MFQSRSTHGTNNRTTALLTGIAIASALVAGGVSAVEMNFESAPAIAESATTA
ncbi:hypothetical protein H9638_02925 [Arthrobacter sp. Sa2BUA2]|uniref:Uncharacterized protein n=1 Tax=Arthrobacter pullicola TaxID=2762224 RepID=A0ABR8YFL8_9MICC|nr:hypothetical protein [Arthrobacter pullicola]MBD8042759.1 hypothetical protein [Arthrobacter pullicola]